MIQKYCPPRRLAKVLSDALEATVPMAFDDASGIPTDVQPDHRTRLRAVEIAARWGNMEPETKNTPPTQKLNLNVFELPSEERRAMIRSLMAEIGVDPSKLIEGEVG